MGEKPCTMSGLVIPAGRPAHGEGKAMYIDSEGTFRPERCRAVAERCEFVLCILCYVIFNGANAFR